jgi:hypothetical protein
MAVTLIPAEVGKRVFVQLFHRFQAAHRIHIIDGAVPVPLDNQVAPLVGEGPFWDMDPFQVLRKIGWRLGPSKDHRTPVHPEIFLVIASIGAQAELLFNREGEYRLSGDTVGLLPAHGA